MRQKNVVWQRYSDLALRCCSSGFQRSPTLLTTRHLAHVKAIKARSAVTGEAVAFRRQCWRFMGQLRVFSVTATETSASSITRASPPCCSSAREREHLGAADWRDLQYSCPSFFIDSDSGSSARLASLKCCQEGL